MDRVSNPDPPPDIEDLRGLARSLRQLFEFGTKALLEDAGPSELGLRVSGHLGCELAAVVLVTERFPKWEHVNVQRGVDAYLGTQQPGEPEWLGAPGTGHHPHEDILSLISSPASQFGAFRVAGPRGHPGRPQGSERGGAASYGTAAIGPEENTEVVTLGLVTATAPDGAAGGDRHQGREPVRAAPRAAWRSSRRTGRRPPPPATRSGG